MILMMKAIVSLVLYKSCFSLHWDRAGIFTAERDLHFRRLFFNMLLLFLVIILVIMIMH